MKKNHTNLESFWNVVISVASIMVEDEVAVISKTDAVGVVIDLVKIINEGALHTFITESENNFMMKSAK